MRATTTRDINKKNRTVTRIINYAVTIYSCYLPHRTVTGAEFAEVIRLHGGDDPRAEIAAATVAEHLIIIKVLADGFAMYNVKK